MILTAIGAIVVYLLITALYQKYINETCKSDKHLKGKTALVTGGTSGIGLEIAKDFARRQAKVIIACPFEEEGLNAEKLIKDETDNEKVIFKFLDLGSFESVRKFAKEINDTEERLDILVNNAGVGTPPDYVTKDGISFVMQVNYFGHFLLTILLLPLLRKSGTPNDKSRIINTSSFLHNIGWYHIDNISQPEWWSFFSYNKSKFCLVLFSNELKKKLQGNVVVNSIDPGIVGTRIYLSSGFLIGDILKVLSYFCYKTPVEGAQTTVYAAIDEKAANMSGEFFKNCQVSKATNSAYDDDLLKKVWDESVKLVKINDSELKTCLEC